MCGAKGSAKVDGQGGHWVTKNSGGRGDSERVWVPDAKTTTTAAATTTKATTAAATTRTGTAQSTTAATRNPDESGLITAARQREAQRSGPSGTTANSNRATVISSLQGVTEEAVTAERVQISSAERARKRAILARKTLATTLG